MDSRDDDALGVPLARIRERMRIYTPRRVDDSAVARAGVAMVLRAGRNDTEMLLIRRAERANDPWSGHVALPGGRQQVDDPDIVSTAMRETREEVGLDLAQHARVLGPLDDLVAVARDRALGLVITPFVCELCGDAELALESREVESALWTPLRDLRRGDALSVYRRDIPGFAAEFPALRYRDYTIWGLTHSIIEGFFRLL